MYLQNKYLFCCSFSAKYHNFVLYFAWFDYFYAVYLGNMAAHSDDPNDLENHLDYDESDDLDMPEQTNKDPEHDKADFHEFLSSLQKTMSTQTALLSILVAERQGEK